MESPRDHKDFRKEVRRMEIESEGMFYKVTRKPRDEPLELKTNRPVWLSSVHCI